MPGVRRFLMEYLQNLTHELADLKRVGATMSGEKSDRRWIRVQIVRFVCGEAGRWLQASKVDKVWNWPWSQNHTECRAFSELCSYYQIWIP